MRRAYRTQSGCLGLALTAAAWGCGGSTGLSGTGGAGMAGAGGAPMGGAPMGGAPMGGAGGLASMGGTIGASDSGGGSGAGGGLAGPTPCGALGWGWHVTVAIAPDGATLSNPATGVEGLTIHRWSDGAKLAGLSSGVPFAMAYSADGTLLADSAADGVEIWRTADFTLLRTIPELAHAQTVAVSNDGSVAVGAQEEAVGKIPRSCGKWLRRPHRGRLPSPSDSIRRSS